MAQATTLIAGNRPALVASNAAVACPASGNTTLLTLSTVGLTRLFVQISVATQALDAFTVSAKAHPSATAIAIASAAADFTSPADPIVDASGDLTTTAAGATGWFLMNVVGFREIVITASGAVNNAAVTIYACGE
jgi:hypothetical protein